jgi:N-acetylglucosamine-6-phosphate deacetylase
MRVTGRLVLTDRLVQGQIEIEGNTIVSVQPDESVLPEAPYIAPGFVDIHVHGWGGHSAMGDDAALTGMSQALLRHGVTSFLPTAVSAPIPDLHRFADRVRSWLPNAPADGAQPLGFNLEGPFLAQSKRGAHAAAVLRIPEDVPTDSLEPLTDGLRVMTVAPELAGALELRRWLAGRGVAMSVGHSAATFEQARAAFALGAKSTTHLFNGMTGIDHRTPGVALAALLDDSVFVELIADGIHVDPALWSLVARIKPMDRLMLVSDAVPLAGTGDGRGWLGTLEVEVTGPRVTLAGTTTLAGSVLSLDVAVRNLVAAGIALPAAVAAASRNPLALLGVTDRGRLAAGHRADLVELDDELRVLRVMRAGEWCA